MAVFEVLFWMKFQSDPLKSDLIYLPFSPLFYRGDNEVIKQGLSSRMQTRLEKMEVVYPDPDAKI